MPPRPARSLVFPLMLVISLALPPARAAAATIDLPCGLRVQLHTAADIAARWLVERGGRRYLVHPAAGQLELLTGVDDPRLLRADAEAFHPLDAGAVARALGELGPITPEIEVHVFLLPSPPAAPQSSFARARVIFLAPGFGPVPATTTAYLAVHELGHVLTNAYFDPHPRRWIRYRELRGLAGRAGATDLHAARDREILAEDIRFLFGGPLATAAGTIENHDLPLPDRVAGLAEFLAASLSGPAALTPRRAVSQASPNPCNPTTTVRMRVEGDPAADLAAAAVLEIYDLRGRRVSTVVGGRVVDGWLAIEWQGRDDAGAAVASGRYGYLVRMGSVQSRGMLSVVR